MNLYSYKTENCSFSLFHNYFLHTGITFKNVKPTIVPPRNEPRHEISNESGQCSGGFREDYSGIFRGFAQTSVHSPFLISYDNEICSQ